MEDILISVIVPVYNTEKYIRKCLDSLVNQSFKSIEIIIVDDGSTDDSGHIVDTYKSDKVTVIHKPNGGSISAKKMGVEAAKGRYVTFVDSDDWVSTDIYSNIADKIKDSDIYIYGLTYIYPDGMTKHETNFTSSGEYIGDELQKVKSTALYAGSIGCFGILPSMCTKLYRRELLAEHIVNVCDDIRMGEDVVNTYPVLCKAKKIIINNDECGYFYRQEVDGAMTSKYRFIENDRINNLFHDLYNYFDKNNYDYMLDQLPYYLAFLMNMQFVGELAHLSIRNLSNKIKNIKYMYSLDWVKQVVKNIDLDEANESVTLFVTCYNRVYRLFYKWYGHRLLQAIKK